MPGKSGDSLKIVTTIGELRLLMDQARATGKSIGYVPTMGALHEGHLSLMRRARRDCDVTIASIFVNPLQFAPTEDLASYPRVMQSDTAAARGVGVELLFAPEVAEMYPIEMRSTVNVAELSAPMEGTTRPTHFAGVATVVAKLFNIVGSCRAYFGEKDFQQLAVIRRMVADLSFPVEVIGCPIIRESDGLAMSSRNIHLTPEQRSAAPLLFRALQAGARAASKEPNNGGAIEKEVTDIVRQEPVIRLDYVALVDAQTLLSPTDKTNERRLLIAAWLGDTRLIDNIDIDTH